MEMLYLIMRPKRRYYPNTENNPSVFRIFLLVVAGKNRVKDIIKYTKEKQSIISRKLIALVRDGLLIKNKWKYEPNWDVIYEKVRKEIKYYLYFFIVSPKEELKEKKLEIKKAEKKVEKFMDLFDRKRIERIVKWYADYFIEFYFRKASLSNMVSTYFDGLSEMDETELKKINPRLLELKKTLSISTMEKVFFRDVELNEI
jgi:DNA-binding transcriptional ArsR family regulator